MRRLDHARIAELGDSIVKLERGPNLTVRGHRDVGGAHRALHQCLVAEEERVVGQLPGNSSPGTDFSRAQESASARTMMRSRPWRAIISSATSGIRSSVV